VGLALGATPAQPPVYREGVRSRWLLGDLDHLLLRLRKSARELQLPETAPGRAQAIWEFMKCFGRDLHYEIEKINDPGPGLFELFEYVRAPFARQAPVRPSAAMHSHV
jgi:hypothetical protein